MLLSRFDATGTKRPYPGLDVQLHYLWVTAPFANLPAMFKLRLIRPYLATLARLEIRVLDRETNLDVPLASISL